MTTDQHGSYLFYFFFCFFFTSYLFQFQNNQTIKISGKFILLCFNIRVLQHNLTDIVLIGLFPWVAQHIYSLLLYLEVENQLDSDGVKIEDARMTFLIQLREDDNNTFEMHKLSTSSNHKTTSYFLAMMS